MRVIAMSARLPPRNSGATEGGSNHVFTNSHTG